MELANGCLCCSVKTEFVTALEGLLRRKSGFDYILIETTGMRTILADHGNMPHIMMLALCLSVWQ